YGMPLTDYLRAHPVSLDGKLKLFVKICHAVSHAHVRGVVHRDLKPSNILVDGEGEPHVLDFGLAKAGFLADMTTSVSAQIVGTPAYMSPEQASGDPSGVDIRTDVYSMGVMLYEALTGEMPYDTDGAMGRILANITAVDPPPPSKINPRIDAELSAIVLKSLQKNKEDRYQSVDALSNDLQHYLAGEPVSARPPSGFYLLRKAMYKYRLPVGIVAVLVIFASAMLLMFRFIRSSKAEVEQARQETRQLQEQVTEKEAARAEAEKGRVQAEAARREYEWLVKNVDPEFAKKLDPFARALGKSVGSGEDPTAIATRFLAQIWSEMDEAQGQQQTKKQDYLPDPSAPLYSSRPTWAGQEKEKAKAVTPAGEELTKKVLDVYLRRIVGQGGPPTSQPATTEPAESETTAQTPPATQPPGPSGG
ncbi:MAG TPA: serine/threonine-protein kinase, partial [Phycisphaerae bacterium]|nr:serine/threonine-protein kinase [Phycisphaerae bacterium]